MKQLRYVHLAAFALLVAFYVAIRWWNLSASCLWFDEIFSIHAAEHSWNTLLSFVALDLIHPPLFYMLLKLWIGLGGESLAWLRMLPAFLSIASLVPLILFLRELKQSVQVQLICMLLLTVNGALLKYSLEVRMYSLLMCLSLFSMWLFARYFIKGKSFIPLVIVNILLIYTHYFGWFVVLSEVAAILIFQRIKWRRILAMFAITFASFVPWVIAIWQAANSGSELGQNIGWMSRPGVREITMFILNVIEPFYSQASTADPISIFKVSLPMLLIVGVAIGLYFINWKQQSKYDRQHVKLFVLFIALPLISAFVLSWLLPYSIWGTRHLIIVFAPVSVLIATAFARITVPALKTGAITLTLLFSGYAFALEYSRPQPQYSWCAWEPLTVAAAAKNDVSIYTFEDLVAYHIWFAGRDQSVNRVWKVNGINGITEDKAYFLPRGATDVAAVNFNEITDRKLWIAYRAKTVTPSEPPLRNLIVGGYRVIDQQVIEADGESVILLMLEK